MNRFLIASALAILLIAGVELHAQTTNDTWEPNNSMTQAANNNIILPQHIGSQGAIGGLGLSFNGRRQYETLLISSSDNDWFAIPSGAIPTTGTPTITVYMNQTGSTAFKLEMEIVDATGTQVAGSTVGGGTYTTLTSPANKYDGQICTVANATQQNYFVHVWYPSTASPPLPSGSTVPYDLSLEIHTGGTNNDAAEGTEGNQFPSYSPNPNFSTNNPADATPSGAGVTNTFSNHTYNGWDYYMVSLANPGSITVALSNLNPTVATYNFDVYWVNSSGLAFDTAPPGSALEGAEDSWPTGFSGNLAAVTTPNTSETLTTGPLAPGDYYFQVTCWDTSSGTGVSLPFRAGTYTAAFSFTNASDDTYEDNDDAMNAKTISTGTTSNLVLVGDATGTEEDWYKFSASDGDNIEVIMTLDVPAQDNLQIELYQPNSTNPGQSADRVDFSIINNRDTQTKGSTTASERVGSWGTIGPSGNTGWDAGDWLIRVYRSGTVHDGGYSLNVSVSGSVDIAPEDSYEPNNNFAEASNSANTYLELSPGLNTGLKAMDFQDWYRIPNVANNDNVEISLVYDANTTTDLDLVLFDLDGGPNVGNGTLTFLGTPDWTNETAANSIVTITSTAGITYTTPPAPSTGDIYVVVQRWNSQGAEYAINVNINSNNPLPVLRINSITSSGNVTPTTNATISVDVENTSNQPADLDTLSLTLTHSGGADVTSEYTITGPTPSVPATIAANTTETFDFVVSGSASTTNGTITVTASGTDGNGSPLLGTPSGTFTMSGGTAPSPNLVYSNITVGGSLIGGGTANVTATIQNNGTLGGTFGNDGSLAFAFDQGGTDVTSSFTLSSTPTLPVTVPAGQNRQVSWSFVIDIATPLGTTQVTISGGGNDNPASGSGSFNIGTFGGGAKGGGGGGCSGSPYSAPWLLFILAMLGAGAWIYRMRLEHE